MRALTIRQPMAHAIAHLGKNLENRSRVAKSLVGQVIAIHAGAAWDDGHAERVEQSCGVRVERSDVTHGAVIATARIARVLEHSDSPWWIGPLALELEDVRPLVAPIPAKGALGYWHLTDEQERDVRAQI